MEPLVARGLQQRRVRQALLVVASACLAMAAIAAYELRTARRAAAPPVLGTLPEFAFTDQAGRPFGSPALEGRVWAASFLFTRCPQVCPRLAAAIAEFQPRALAAVPTLRFVSFSVDPKNDTPERLTEFAQRHHADLSTWTFLTGDELAVGATVVEGFKVALSRDPSLPESDPNRITHSTHLVLIDGQRRIRGYYDTSERSRLDALVADARYLVSEGSAAAAR